MYFLSPIDKSNQINMLSSVFRRRNRVHSSTIITYINRNVRKRTSRHARPAKIQISIRADWSESSQGAFCTAKDAKFLRANNEDSYQTARIHRLTCVSLAHMSEGTLPDVAAYMTRSGKTDLFPRREVMIQILQRMRTVWAVAILFALNILQGSCNS